MSKEDRAVLDVIESRGDKLPVYLFLADDVSVFDASCILTMNVFCSHHLTHWSGVVSL